MKKFIFAFIRRRWLPVSVAIAVGCGAASLQAFLFLSAHQILDDNSVISRFMSSITDQPFSSYCVLFMLGLLLLATLNHITELVTFYVWKSDSLYLWQQLFISVNKSKVRHLLDVDLLLSGNLKTALRAVYRLGVLERNFVRSIPLVLSIVGLFIAMLYTNFEFSLYIIILVVLSAFTFRQLKFRHRGMAQSRNVAHPQDAFREVAIIALSKGGDILKDSMAREFGGRLLVRLSGIVFELQRASYIRLKFVFFGVIAIAALLVLSWGNLADRSGELGVFFGGVGILLLNTARYASIVALLFRFSEDVHHYTSVLNILDTSTEPSEIIGDVHIKNGYTDPSEIE